MAPPCRPTSRALAQGMADSMGIGLMAIKNRAGLRYGRWTVLRFLDIVPGSDARHTITRWFCRCACGVERAVNGNNLATGGSKSCGCLSRERATRIARLNFADRFARNTLPTGRSAAHGLYHGYQCSATKRRLSFGLSLARFIQLTSSPCAYCGCAPHRLRRPCKRGNGGYVYNGIDRVDNVIGYEEGNVVPCCFTCNDAKKTRSEAEFLAWVERIYVFRIGGANAERAS